MPKQANWKTHGVPFLDFTPELTEQWRLQGFSKDQCQDWLGIGLSATEAFYAGWLRDIKNLDSDWVLNFGDGQALRAEYKAWQLEQLKDLKVPKSAPTAKDNWTWLLTIIALLLTYYLLTKYV